MKSHPFQEPNRSQTKLPFAAAGFSSDQTGIDSLTAPPTATHSHLDEADNDSTLIALGSQFEQITAQLDSLPTDASEDPQQIEVLLARLDPIERAIMATPARTIDGLGVKARHLAYTVSEHWGAPIDQISWDARAVRLFVEAVWDLVRTCKQCETK
jgi:hypothetical protein